MAIVNKTKTSRCLGRCGEKGALTRYQWKHEPVPASMQINIAIPQKFKTKSTTPVCVCVVGV